MSRPRVPWLEPGEPFPHPHEAWGPNDPAPGLLAGGGALDLATLLAAYRQGIFPWFGPADPIKWWCPHPRMVLQLENFRLHRSLRKTLQRFRASPDCEIRFDHDFSAVMRACGQARRRGQAGSWIHPVMIDAYAALHNAGYAHSVETWSAGRLQGGLYCVCLGHAVFGESMFARTTDASKIALAALVAHGRAAGVPVIDCQQNTRHLASLGAAEIERDAFLQILAHTTAQPALPWRFDPACWSHLLGDAA